MNAATQQLFRSPLASQPRQGVKAILFNFGDNPLTRIDGSSVEGVAYFVEKADEYYALRDDYGPRFWLRCGKIVLETGEGTARSLFFGRAESPPR